MWKRASYRVMRREGSRRSSSFEASTRLARRRRVWPIATVPCSRFVVMASARRWPVGYFIQWARGLPSFISRGFHNKVWPDLQVAPLNRRRCSNISLSRDSNRRFSQSRSGPTFAPPSAIAVVPQSQRSRRGLPQTKESFMSWDRAHESRSLDSKRADRLDSDFLDLHQINGVTRHLA
jgi:hypothetical protein